MYRRIYKTKGVLKIMFSSLLSVFGGCSKSAKTPTLKRGMTNAPVYDAVTFPNSLWTAEPVYNYAPEFDRTAEEMPTETGVIKGLWLKSDYDGKESYAFGYLGIPTGATKDNKYPAVLLVHGGGGTAYWQWVKEWVARGFVALALDMEGNYPIMTGTINDQPAQLRTKSQYPAPNNVNYNDTDNNPIEKTWMYQATSTAIRGNTLLHNLEFVDKYKIGVCGVSWGGVITSIITGYDDRFAFSIPIYCSLNLNGAGGFVGGYYTDHANARVWDNDKGLSARTTPLQFIIIDADKAATPESVSATYMNCKNARFTIHKGEAHSHASALTYYEAFEFALSVINGKKLVTFKNQPTTLGGTLKLALPKGVTIKEAYVATTKDEIATIPTWQYSSLKINKNKVSLDIQLDSNEPVTYFYVCVVDSLGNTTTTKVVKMG